LLCTILGKNKVICIW